jgi:hypothetical protein
LVAPSRGRQRRRDAAPTKDSPRVAPEAQRRPSAQAGPIGDACPSRWTGARAGPSRGHAQWSARSRRAPSASRVARPVAGRCRREVEGAVEGLIDARHSRCGERRHPMWLQEGQLLQWSVRGYRREVDGAQRRQREPLLSDGELEQPDKVPR